MRHNNFRRLQLNLSILRVLANFTPVSKIRFFGIQDGDSSILEFILEIYSRKSDSTLPVTTSTLSQTAKAIRNGIVEEFEKEGLLSVNTDKVFPINPMVIIIVNKTNLQNNAKLYTFQEKYLDTGFNKFISFCIR